MVVTQHKSSPLVQTPSTPEEATAILAALNHIASPSPETEKALAVPIVRRNVWLTKMGKTLLREQDGHWAVACYLIDEREALELIAALCDALDLNSLRLESIAEAPFAVGGEAA